MSSLNQLGRLLFMMLHTRVDRDGYTWLWPHSSYRSLVLGSRLIGKTRPTANAYLTRHPDKYDWSNLWLQHGKTFMPPRKHEHLQLIRSGGLMTPSYCYRNSLFRSWNIQRLIPGDPDVLYVEGLAIGPTGPYPHAWIVKDNRVYDPTWSDAWMCTYFGVTFDPNWAYERVQENQGRLGFIAHWAHYKQIIRRKLQEGY